MSKDPICKKCKGKGKIIKSLAAARPWSDPKYEPSDVVYEDCPKCKGRIRKVKNPIRDK